MASFYSPSELRDIGIRIAREAGSFSAELESLHRTALLRLMELPAMSGYRKEVLAMLPGGFSDGLDNVSPSRSIAGAPIDAGSEHGRVDQLPEGADELEKMFRARALLDRAFSLTDQDPAEDALAIYDEVVRRFGETETPTLLEFVAIALVNKGLTLAEMNRTEEALTIYDEVVRRFAEARTPVLLESVPTALVNKGVTLAEMNRTEEALATYDEVVRRFGETETPALLEQVTRALVSKGVTLAEMNRTEEALAAYDEMVHRFGKTEMPTHLEHIARALFDKGVTLAEMNRTEEALAAYDEVVHRFGESRTPALLDPVARAMINKGVALGGMDRKEEQLEAYDEVLRRFGATETPTLLEHVARALVNKGVTLGGMNRTEEALGTFDEVVRRIGENDSPELRKLVERALLAKAAVELNLHQYRAVIETAGQALARPHTSLSETQWPAHVIRARAALAGGDRSACEDDVGALLALLPELGSLSKESLNALMFFGVALGPKRMCKLIEASPSANLLLPLTTALELELGLEPRVAQEVREVAEDIRKDLAMLREAGTGGPSGEKESPTAVGPERNHA